MATTATITIITAKTVPIKTLPLVVSLLFGFVSITIELGGVVSGDINRDCPTINV